MKLIIDIPDEKHKTFQSGMYCGMTDVDLYRSIKNGIPLDNIKAEIEHLPFTMFDKKEVLDRQEVIGIINKHIKGEQE